MAKSKTTKTPQPASKTPEVDDDAQAASVGGATGAATGTGAAAPSSGG
jgi:hypothetical protein